MRSLTGALIPFMRSIPSLPKYLPETASPNSVSVGILGFQQMNFLGDTNIQSITLHIINPGALDNDPVLTNEAKISALIHRKIMDRT